MVFKAMIGFLILGFETSTEILLQHVLLYCLIFNYNKKNISVSLHKCMIDHRGPFFHTLDCFD